MIHSIDLSLVCMIFGKAGYPVTTEPGEGKEPLELRYRNNPDGTVRWLWPADSRQPDCLRFYNTGSSRARLFARAIQWSFRLGMQRLVSNGVLRLYLDSADAGRLAKDWGGRFAIFTGTVGENRKAVIWHMQEQRSVFVKVALTAVSEQVVQHEKQVLQQLPAFSSIHYPAIYKEQGAAVSLEDVAGPAALRSAVLMPVHGEALREIHEHTGSPTTIAGLAIWQQAKCQLKTLLDSRDERLPRGLIRKLAYLAATIDEQQVITCGMAHGDFTPWNMYVDNDSLKLYDWELSIRQAPALWDAYHFLFQAGVLMHYHSGQALVKQALQLQEEQWVKKMQQQAPFDARLHLQLYLLINAVYYLHLYNRQAKWHIQVQWLISTWNEAISILLDDAQVLSPRQLVCMDLFDSLGQTPYVVMKWRTSLPEELSLLSDIDLCTTKAGYATLTRFFKTHPFCSGLQQQRRSFMRTYTLVLTDGTLLSVDAIQQFKRKALQMLDAAAVLRNRSITSAGVQVPAVEMDFLYTWLFYLLNGAEMHPGHQQYFMQQPAAARQRIQQYITTTFSFAGVQDITTALVHSTSLQQKVVTRLRSLPANTGWRALINRVNYYLDIARTPVDRRGMIITFSGVDGAGKSTVIENTRQQLEKGLRRKVVVLRHRPSVLPILSAWKHGKQAAEQKAAVTLPRQGQNRNRLSSLIRFGYYYADYLLGQFYILFKYVWRGYVVLYDRYYFDFINDSRRSNIHLPADFTRWFYRFLLKPQLNFFLYAAPEEILQRKQELDASTIKELTARYLELFNSLSRRYHSSSYIPIHNQQLDTTINTIVEHIKKRA